ncbi:hypothetical protein [Streptomyces mobaraensis]|uniref:hypothetical protein n=1 Tax=Streptomyces mobaraensis TaxID=35621 RepID=UPI0033EBB379
MTTYTFASWDRSGAAASLTDPDDLVRTTPVRGALAATASVNGGTGRPVPVPALRLYGPGDVRAIDPNEIVRIFPLPGTPDAETTRFPMVEFERTEVPWLFTPLTPGATGSLRPWLALVCVPLSKGRPERVPGARLPVLRVEGGELPDPATLHLWAHAQTLPGHETDPRRSVSRLLCPRRLLPYTTYTACLVPAFEAGRLAGLEQPLDGAGLAPAWGTGTETRDLPVYFSWTFATAEAGDFETLADRLRARPLPAQAGRRPLDISRPGLFAEGPGSVVQEVESALRAPGAPVEAAWPTGPQSARWRQRLADAIAPIGDGSGDEDPDVLPPLYGGFHALRKRADPTSQGWLDILNLDPRWRVAAGLGARAVQAEQEDLMASAWRQLADVRAANRVVDLGRFARLVAGRLHLRHVTPLSADEVLRLVTPSQSRLPLAADTTLWSSIRSSPLPNAMATTAFFRAVRPMGVLSRRMALVSGAAAVPVDPAKPMRSARAVGTVETADPVGTAGPVATADERDASRPPPFAGVLTAVAASPTGLAVTPRDPDGAVCFAVPPERVVAAERLEAVRKVFAPLDGASDAWKQVAADAAGRSLKRRVTTEQLAATPPVPATALNRAFRIPDLPEAEAPADFLARTAVTPEGDLVFPSGRTGAAGLGLFTERTAPGAPRGGFAGQWIGPWDSVAHGDAAGNWKGACHGTWNLGAGRSGRWKGDFVGTWSGRPPAGGTDYTWLALFTGTWETETENGTWRGACTGTWRENDNDSDGVFTGTWRSALRHGTFQGTCPGTWDWNTDNKTGVWWADCHGDLRITGDGPGGDQAPWDTGVLQGLVDQWGDAHPLGLGVFTDPGVLVEQQDQLPVPVVVGARPEDLRDMVVSAHDRSLKPSDAPPVPTRDPFPAQQNGQLIVGLTDPAVTVPAAVAARVDPPDGGDPQTPVQWAPVFTDAMWPPLSGQSREWMFGGLEHVPADTAVLALTNAPFVAAYMVGLNHEFARELRWRAYPTDQRGTYFASFWGYGTDLPPLHTWQLGLPLGAHLTAPPDRVVLVLRSALLRRYPGAIIYAAPLNGSDPDEDHARHPIFRGGLDPDTAMLGFDLTETDLTASPWCFVIAEQPTEPRFGLDDPDPHLGWGSAYQAPNTPGDTADDWNNLSWTHLFDSEAAYQAATHAPGTVRPNVAYDGLVWGTSAAGTARQCFQQPVRVVMPADRLLHPEENDR